MLRIFRRVEVRLVLGRHKRALVVIEPEVQPRIGRVAEVDAGMRDPTTAVIFDGKGGGIAKRALEHIAWTVRHAMEFKARIGPDAATVELGK